tara:strand:- start:54 stop:425 length:372 start_codon:yes stop_codon:yes gene_type:complete
MYIPYDVKVFEACQILNSKIVTCSGIKSNDITDLITTDESGAEITLDKTELEAEIKKIEAAEPMRLLRIERDRRIAKTDWRASSDLTLTDAWKTYRQALRDLPANQTPVDKELSNITWPTEPS